MGCWETDAVVTEAVVELIRYCLNASFIGLDDNPDKSSAAILHLVCNVIVSMV